MCYVGLTRGQSQAYLTYARQRRLFRDIDKCFPSHFIGEITEDLREPGSTYRLPKTRPVLDNIRRHSPRPA